MNNIPPPLPEVSASETISFAKPRGFSLLLCAKPTVWLRCIPITATTLDVVDAAVARDLCAKRNLPLDRAAGWHGGVIREKKIASVAWAE